MRGGGGGSYLTLACCNLYALDFNMLKDSIGSCLGILNGTSLLKLMGQGKS